jgi:hypothetical protein
MAGIAMLHQVQTNARVSPEVAAYLPILKMLTRFLRVITSRRVPVVLLLPRVFSVSSLGIHEDMKLAAKSAFRGCHINE